MADSVGPCGLQLTRLLCPWNSPDKNTGVDCHALLQGTVPTQGLNSLLMSYALAGGFFTTNTTWEACKSTVFQQKLSSTAAACKVPLSPGYVTSLRLSFLVCPVWAMVRKLWGGAIDSTG